MSQGAVVILPARGGSTRIPRKNIQSFNGAPMITWPILAALAEPGVARVIVSTDDPEIAGIAVDAGAEVPFTRPGELATHHAGTAPVVVHALGELGLSPETPVMCLYPTAALPSRFIGEALHLGQEHPNDFIISVGRHRSPLERALEENDAGRMVMSHPGHLLTRTQDLPTRYFDAGKFYVAPVRLWEARQSMMAEPFVPYFLPEWATVDIDEPGDWPLAEALHRAFADQGPA